MISWYNFMLVETSSVTGAFEEVLLCSSGLGEWNESTERGNYLMFPDSQEASSALVEQHGSVSNPRSHERLASEYF